MDIKNEEEQSAVVAKPEQMLTLLRRTLLNKPTVYEVFDEKSGEGYGHTYKVFNLKVNKLQLESYSVSHDLKKNVLTIGVGGVSLALSVGIGVRGPLTGYINWEIPEINAKCEDVNMSVSFLLDKKGSRVSIVHQKTSEMNLVIGFGENSGYVAKVLDVAKNAVGIDKRIEEMIRSQMALNMRNSIEKTFFPKEEPEDEASQKRFRFRIESVEVLKKKKEEKEEEEEKKDEESSNLTLVSSLAGSVAVVGGIGLFLYKKYFEVKK